jgi:hypothetical protein
MALMDTLFSRWSAMGGRMLAGHTQHRPVGHSPLNRASTSPKSATVLPGGGSATGYPDPFGLVVGQAPDGDRSQPAGPRVRRVAALVAISGRR